MKWHLASSPAQYFHAQLYGALKDFEAAALNTVEGSTIHVKWGNPTDVSTLSSVAQTVHKYMKLSDSEIAIVNDPFSGGSQLSDLTFVVGIGKTAGPADLLLTVRMQCAGRIGDKSVEEEGVRIPPTPLGTLTQLNTPLIQAINQHPLAPKNLAENIDQLIPKLKKVRAQLQEILAQPRGPLSKAGLEQYFELCSAATHRRMAQLPLGDHTITRKLSSGANLKLRVSVHDQIVEFDFSGSEGTGNVQLTQQTSLGACVAATMRATGMNWPINSGVLSAFAVRTPTRTCVNASYPSPTRKGVSEGVFVIADMVFEHLVRNASYKAAKQAGPSLAIELIFADGKHLFDHVANGRAATATEEGKPALNSWNQDEYQIQSAEKLERDYPLRVVDWGLRFNSAGNGKFKGGLGYKKSVELLADAELRWDQSALVKPEGANEGDHGVEAEIVITPPGGKPKPLGKFGAEKLEAGTVVRWCSAGGGGYGKPKDD